MWIDRKFQLKYASLLIGASLLGLVLTILPISHLIDQNYRIFVDLSYDTAPELLSYLEKERFWINTILLSVFCGLLVFFGILSFRMTEKIVGPLHVLRNHLRQLIKGNWTQTAIKIRQDDEFQELVDSYNYFYKSMRNNIERDIQRLCRIKVDPINKDAYSAWHDILEEKVQQIGKTMSEVSPELTPISLNSSTDASSRDSRHAS